MAMNLVLVAFVALLGCFMVWFHLVWWNAIKDKHKHKSMDLESMKNKNARSSTDRASTF